MRVCTKKLISLTIAFVMLFTLLPFSASADDTLTNTEVCQLIVEYFGLEYKDYMALPKEYASLPEAVAICSYKGIIGGTPALSYPTEDCSRKNAALMLNNCGLPQKALAEPPGGVEASSIHYNAVCTVLSAGVMGVDVDGEFRPERPVRRSEIDMTKYDSYMAATTSEPVNLDISDGAVIVTTNLKGVRVWKQGGTEKYRTEEGSATITQSNTAVESNTITVTDSTVELTIDSLNIKVADSPMKVVKNSDVKLTLQGVNVFESTAESSGETAGILVVTSAITIRGIGSLTATGGMYSAGIGGGNGESCGKVNIESGTVTAIGGKYAAGIGGGKGGAGGTVSITGGTVTVSGWYNAIGGGNLNNSYGCDSVTITGTTPTLSHSVPEGANIQRKDSALRTITFDSNDGSEVAPITAQAKEPISEPEAPKKAGHYFAGWFKDTACTAQAFDFTTMPDESLTPLYAKWMVDGTQRGIEYSVSLSVGNETAIPNGDFTVTASIGVLEGGSAGSDILVLAVYDASGRMLENHCVNFSSSVNDPTALTVPVANSGGAAARIKAFILPRYGPTAPLAAAASFPAAGI